MRGLNDWQDAGCWILDAGDWEGAGGERQGARGDREIERIVETVRKIFYREGHEGHEIYYLLVTILLFLSWIDKGKI